MYPSSYKMDRQEVIYKPYVISSPTKSCILWDCSTHVALHHALIPPHPYLCITQAQTSYKMISHLWYASVLLSACQGHSESKRSCKRQQSKLSSLCINQGRSDKKCDFLLPGFFFFLFYFSKTEFSCWIRNWFLQYIVLQQSKISKAEQFSL